MSTARRSQWVTGLALGWALAVSSLTARGGPEAQEARAPQGAIARREAESPFVAFNIWLKVGSQNDPEGKEGLATLTARLLSSGSTSRHTYQEIVAKLFPMAAGYGASVDKEMTNFRGTVHTDNLEGYYELLRNALL